MTAQVAMSVANVASFSKKQAVINWTAPATANKCFVISYDIQLRTKAATTSPVAAATYEALATTAARVNAYSTVAAVPTKTTYTDAKARIAGAYYYSVKATNAAGSDIKMWSDDVAYYYAGVPSQVSVTDNKATVQTAIKITFVWTKPIENGDAVTKYTVYSGTVSPPTTANVLANVLTFSLDTTGKGFYYFQVSAFNKLGESTKSAVLKVLSSAGPQPPAGVKFPSPTNDLVKIEWNNLTSTAQLNSNASITGWKIQRAMSAHLADFTDLVEIATNTKQSYDDNTKGTADGYLWYRIMAKGNVGGYGPYTDPAKALSVCASCKTLVTEFKQSEFSHGYLNMSWKAVAAATQYYVSYANTIGSTFAERETAKAGLYTDAPTCTTNTLACRYEGSAFSLITITTTFNGSRYWRIRPLFAAGGGVAGDPVLMWRASAPAAPTAVVNRGAADKKYYATASTVQIAWTAPT